MKIRFKTKRIQKMPECNICVFERRKFVTCPFCQFQCCTDCFKKHLLTIKLLQPFCMNCNHQQDLEFIAENTPNSFYNTTYREHRVNLLFEYEKSLLPEFQKDARIVKKSKELREKNKVLISQINELHNKADDMYNRIHRMTVMDNNLFDEHQEIRNLIWEKETEKMLNNREILGFYKTNYDFLRERVQEQINTNHEAPVETSAPRYVSKCFNDECKGFIKSKKNSLECELCSMKYCVRCHIILEDEHKCDENAVLTITELKESTKPCPKCTTPIFKNGGCDQMFCTSCKTAFDWKSGKIVTTAIHNPHYFEYMRSIQQQIPTVDEEYDRAYAEAVQNGTEQEFFQARRQCGQVNFYAILDYMTRSVGINEEIFSLEQRDLLLRDINFIEDIVRRYGWNIRDYEDTRKLKIQFLNSEIDENYFKKELRYRDKHKEKLTVIRNLLTMYRETAILLMEKIYDIYNRKIPDALVITFLEEMKGLDNYTEAQLDKIRRRFKCVVPNIYHSRRPTPNEENLQKTEDDEKTDNLEDEN